METIAVRRLAKEFAECEEDLPFKCIVNVEEDLFHWQCFIEGPVESPFRGRYFEIDITFPTNYPASPPDLKFITKIYHPNIKGNGVICMDSVKRSHWKSDSSVGQILKTLHYLLSNPNPADPLVLEIADHYKSNKAGYEKTAEQWTRTHGHSL